MAENKAELIDRIIHKHNISKECAERISTCVNAFDMNGNTLLHYAAKTESVEYLTSLVELGYDWNAKTFGTEKTVLHLAAEEGNFDAIKCFVGLGADVETKTVSKLTPIHFVAFTKQHFKKTLGTLIDCGADVNAVDSHGRNLVLLAVVTGRSRNELEEIVRLGGDWQAKDRFGDSGLHWGVNCGNIGALKYFIELGADVNLRDNDGKAPIHHIAYCANDSLATTILHELVKNGADLNGVDKNGNSVLKVTRAYKSMNIKLIDEIKNWVEDKLENVIWQQGI